MELMTEQPDRDQEFDSPDGEGTYGWPHNAEHSISAWGTMIPMPPGSPEIRQSSFLSEPSANELSLDEQARNRTMATNSTRIALNASARVAELNKDTTPTETKPSFMKRLIRGVIG